MLHFPFNAKCNQKLQICLNNLMDLVKTQHLFQKQRKFKKFSYDLKFLIKVRIKLNKFLLQWEKNMNFFYRNQEK